MDIENNPSSIQLSIEQRFKLLIDAVSDYAIYMLTPEGIVDSWNSGAQRIKGYSADEIIGKHFSCFYLPEDRAAGMPEKALQTAAANGKFEGEGWRVRKDGTHFWASVVLDPIVDPSGKLIGFAKVTRDITERKQTQEALRESERRFRLLVEGVTDYAICMLTPGGIISNWNSGAQRIMGYDANEIVGKDFSCFYVAEDDAETDAAKAIDTATAEGRFEQEGWHVRKDGSRFWAHVIVDAIRDDDGILIGFAHITRDITERRNAAILLEQTKVALFQAQKMEMIGKLTGGIAHDFNNLLAGIMGNLDLMRLRLALGQTSDLGRHIEAASAATKRSAALTHRLLAFSRRQALNPKPVDVNWLVHSIADLIRRTIGPGIELEAALEEGIWWTLCDPGQLENALLNLAINARDAMPEGGKLTIQTANIVVRNVDPVVSAGLATGEYVIVKVIDNGIGMSPEILGHAFDPFFTTKPIGEGSGLGLSMIHGFIHQSGGHIHIDSTEGQGTTVTLYLPRHTADALSVNGQNLGSDIATDSPRDSSTVLLVDDDPVVRASLVEMLREFGYELLEAQNAHEGLRLLESGKNINLLITDIGLPGGMSGRQLADACARLRPELKVLFITGYADNTLKDYRALPPNMELMVKPFMMEDFAGKVRTMLG